LVIFAHASGSSRFSPRNRFVASVLHAYRISTLLIDLLTTDEERVDEQTMELRFDIDLLADRLMHIGAWVHENPVLKDYRIGYFGASTGAAAALIAAANQPNFVKAVVSRGGRVDLADTYFESVQAPVLLIVGSQDKVILEINKKALFQLNKESKLEVIPGATHLFEEQGALECVANISAKWFEQKLCSADAIETQVSQGCV